MTVGPRRHGGRMIVLEGAEGVGKTTQAGHLADALRAAEVPVVIVREPGATWLGEKIRGLLLDARVDIEPPAEAFLFLAARAQLMRDIRAHVHEGKTVVADRFFLSTYAYQIAGRGLPADLVRSANRLAVADFVPDLTVVLNFPVHAGLDRTATRGGDLDRIERASAAFHESVAAAFQEFLTKEWQGAHPESGPLVGVDATGSEAMVTHKVLEAVTARWPSILDGGGVGT
jgi:dTMP kinase